MRLLPNVVLVAVFASLVSCGPKGAPAEPTKPAAASGGEVIIYTSMYQEVVELLDPVIEKKLGGTKVTWVQAGSGKIAKRLDRELAGGGSPADLLLIADPAYYRKLKAAGTLVAYKSEAAGKQPEAMRDPDGAYVTARFSTMVIGLSPELAVDEAAKKPAAFKDLGDPANAKRVAIGDPLVSGTSFTTVAVLSERLGWDFFKALKAKKALAAGSNSTVLQRLDTGLSDAGIVLLENLLAAKAGGSKVGVVYPTDGAVIIPGPMALLPHAKDSKQARDVYDAMLSEEVQNVIVTQGFMHSPDPSMTTPEGAPALNKLLGSATMASLYEPRADADAIKATFSGIFTSGKK